MEPFMFFERYGGHDTYPPENAAMGMVVLYLPKVY